MKNSKETRTCVGCLRKDKKRNLIRIVKENKKGICIDFDQNIKARGAYICKKEECFIKMEKRKALNRAFKENVSIEKYNELRGVMFDK